MSNVIKKWLPLATALFVLACGVPEEQYQEKVNQVNKLKEALNAAADTNMQLQDEISRLRADNQKLANKLNQLGQDVNALLGEKSALAEDLEATKAREARLKAERDAQLARMARYRSVIEKFQKLVKSGKLKIKIVNGQMVVQMASAILFETGKAELSDDGKEALTELAGILASIKGRKFQIAGHTDNIPINSRKFPSNWELSAARAVTVVKHLQESGVNPKNVSAAGYAEYQPTSSNNSRAGQAANRRIEITLLPNLDELPDLSDLEKDL